MQAIDVKKHSRLLKVNTTAGSTYHRILFRLLFPGCMQKKVAHDFRYDLRI
jgi:hypothetical protein